MSKTRGNYGSGVVRPKTNDKTHFESQGPYLKELRENTFSGSKHEDANEHIKKFLEIIDLFHIPETLEESLTKFMAESVKRHEEKSNIIKEIRASTDVVIRNQGASIKTLEIHIGQMSKVLHEKGIGGLPNSTEPNPRDHVKSMSTTKADSSEIRRVGCSPYIVSGSQHRSIFSEIVPLPRRLQDYCCDNWREAQDVKILEAYDHTLP
nr:hypothetical protein [Tanacetum cinerariifolium]